MCPIIHHVGRTNYFSTSLPKRMNRSSGNINSILPTICDTSCYATLSVNPFFYDKLIFLLSIPTKIPIKDMDLNYIKICP